MPTPAQKRKPAPTPIASVERMEETAAIAAKQDKTAALVRRVRRGVKEKLESRFKEFLERCTPEEAYFLREAFNKREYFAPNQEVAEYSMFRWTLLARSRKRLMAGICSVFPAKNSSSRSNGMLSN